ncbi:MAG: DEAD/DEAH box helicase family protein [Methyloprofundus sp.]|nr:DEAD/DEAH box helicase family protein [Methyloprofundus sp.]
MEFKEYQEGVLAKLDYYLTKLSTQKEEAEDFVAFQATKGKKANLANFAQTTWDELVNERRVDYLLDKKGKEVVPPYISRFDGLDRTIPNICFKVPTGGGKTLLGAASIERIQTDLFKQQTGIVLWIVPSDAIYKQTWKQLANREHPYRQMLERASGGQVKLLEKNDAFTKRDVDENLCVMLLMLQSSNRKTKETLKMFRDSGRFTNFFPIEDDQPANNALLDEIRNLDCNDLSDYGWAEGVSPDSISIKHSLGNVLRICRPLIVIDEGHKAYSDSARDTLCGFNPKFILELSATPNTNGKHQSNILVNVSGNALKDEHMIKLPINLINDDKGDWKQTLTAAHEKLEELNHYAVKLQHESGRYIRPIMLIRVERTGSDQRDSKYVHAEDAKEYLMDKLGVAENTIRLKTSEKDELGNDDLLEETCPVRFIITKDALKEGWDCPFAYVLTVLSKMTASTAITQMIGRVLRQPHVTLTDKQALNECYVFTFDQDVSEAVKGVKQGLEDEGLGDISNQLKTGNGKEAPQVSKETLQRRDKFKNLPRIFLPSVLHQDASANDGYRKLDYERDILGDIDWDLISFKEEAEEFAFDEELISRSVTKIDYKQTKGKQGVLDLSDPDKEYLVFDQQSDLDISFLVRQLTEIIPNPWQAMRVLEESLEVLKTRNISQELIHSNRLELLKEMKKVLKVQVLSQSESLFKQKLSSHDISLKLVASSNLDLNWELAQTVEVNVSENDQILRRKDGSELEKSLFEKVYQSGINTLEKDSAWYLDKANAVYWWHRIAVNQREYSLQGWQKQRVYPDLLVCVEEPSSGNYRFSLLETKGEHLKGNDDTNYKRDLFDLLTAHAQSAIEAGELTIETADDGISFRMLLESDWQQELVKELG